jgi:hypothetical protein
VVDLADVPDHPQIVERRLVHRVSDDPALIETLFPAWVDGEPPRPRTEVRFAEAAEVLSRWQGK